MFALFEMTLSKIRIWNCKTSQHFSHDRNLFSQSKPLTNQFPIQKLGGKIAPQGIEAIKVSCKGKNEQLTYLFFKKVLFMPGLEVNLISQGQLCQGDNLVGGRMMIY